MISLAVHRNNADSVMFVYKTRIILYKDCVWITVLPEMFLVERREGFVALLARGGKNKTNRDVTKPCCYVLC